MVEVPQKTFITGVNFIRTEEKLSWKICNLVDVLSDNELIEAQTFEFETGSSSTNRLKWKMGMRHDSDNKFCIVYLKLLEENLETFPVKVKSSLSISLKSSKLWTAGLHEKILNKGDEITWTNALEYNRDDKFWSEYIDTEKPVTLIISIATKQRSGMVNETSGSMKVASFKESFISNLQKNFATLLTDTSSSDMKIITNDEKEFSAHGIVLKAQCSVFESMLSPTSKFAESEKGIIKVEDVSGKTMEIILNYLYTGDLLPGWRDADIIWEFVYAAGKYQLLEVMEMLDEVIGSDEDADSTCTLSLLSLVAKLGLKKAESRLVQRIIRRTSAAKSCEDIFNVFDSSNKQ